MKIAILGLIIIGIASAQFMSGGFMEHDLNGSTITRTTNLMKKVRINNSSFNAQGKTLVYYGTQVVAGANHALIYKVHSSLFKGYECYKVYQSLDGKIEVIEHGNAASLVGAGEKCNIPNIQ